MIKVQPYVLRSWEKEFPDLGTARTAGGPRFYRPADVERVQRLKQLVFGEGLTIAGARRRLEEQGYRDLRNVTPNGDGTFSARGIRQDPPGMRRPGSNPEVNVEIDASGRVRER